MNSNQIYILRNSSFQKNILKIGRTTTQPLLRAKQIYAGATGVPAPFDVIFACSVANCTIAERKVHRRLAAFRVNDSREFFRIPEKIARQIVLDVCSAVNSDHHGEQPLISLDLIADREPESRAIDQYHEKYGEILSVPARDMQRSPAGTSVVTPGQKERISIVSAILYDVYPDSTESWHRSFSCDINPEPELRIWEHIAKAFLKIDEYDYLNALEKKEAYKLLLARSLKPPKTVLQEHKLNYFTVPAALRIMAGYELPPKPLTVIRTGPRSWINNNLNLKPNTSVIPAILASHRKKSD